MPYKDLYLVRASTYLLAVVNYHVGQAAIVGYLYRVRRVPLLRASGWILFIIGINVGTLFLLASAGATRVNGRAARCCATSRSPAASASSSTRRCSRVKPRILAERTLFKPLFEMGITGHIYGVLVRLPHIGVLLVWHFVSLRMFGVRGDAGRGAALPAGLLRRLVAAASTSTASAWRSWSRSTSSRPTSAAPAGADDARPRRPAVIAYSLATSGISIVLQMVLGVICLRWATARGLKPQPVEADRRGGDAS